MNPTAAQPMDSANTADVARSAVTESHAVDATTVSENGESPTLATTAASTAELPVSLTADISAGVVANIQRPPPVAIGDAPPIDGGPMWSAGDRRFLMGIVVLVLALSTAQWARMSGWGRRPIEISRLPSRVYEFRVEINSATWVEWMQLEDIGEVLARKIVADREERGPFRSIEELDRVPGLGAKTIASIRPWLDCRDCEAASAAP